MDKTLAALYAIGGVKQSSNRKEQVMLTGINYELVKYETNERLKKAAHDHLVQVFKVASKTKPKRKWSLKLFSR